MKNHKLLVAGFDPGCLAGEKGIRKVGSGPKERKRGRERVRQKMCLRRKAG